MPRNTYLICGIPYTSDTALRKAWRTVSPLLSESVLPAATAEQDSGKRYMCDADAAWYIEAAWATPFRRKYLRWVNLDNVKARYKVFVARGDFLSGSSAASKYRSVFFERDDKTVQTVSAEPVAKQTLPYNAINRMLRTAIAPQIQRFRNINKQMARGMIGGKRMSIKCGICKKRIVGESHVDHGIEQLSFEHIAREFLKSVVPAGTIGVHTQDVLSVLPRNLPRWEQFHEQRAVLRMTHAKCNLTNK
jgi:hypothetical protein